MFARLPPVTLFLSGLTMALLPTGCRVKEATIEEQDRFFKVEAIVVPEAHLNQLAAEPTAFLRSRAKDPIHWQPWAAPLLEQARLEQKPIFALITGGKFPRSRDILDNLAADPRKVRTLHSSQLCTLVDIEAHPEMGLLAYHLARQIDHTIAFPFLCWFTYEGSAIAWIPISSVDAENFDAVFDSTTEMVQDRWKDDPRYVINNSRRDNLKRATQLADELSASFREKDDLEAGLQRAARELTALYDPTSGQIDRSGGLVPFPILQFAAVAANDPATTPSLRDRLREMLAGHSAVIRNSAIHDPLDGGYFYGRQSQHGWSLPVFMKDSSTQLDGAIAYSSLASVLDREVMTRAAADTLNFARGRFGDESGAIGLFEVPPPESQAARCYLWARETLQELLPADEYSVVEKCFDIRAIGNVPSEADPRRDFFRLNSLRDAMTPEEAAGELGLTPERARELLKAARQRLLVQRRELIDHGAFVVETARITAINARLVTALVKVGEASGDDALLVEARTLLRFLRDRHYSEEGGLSRIPAADGRRAIPARGRDYACLLEALLAMYRHDLDPEHLVWADRLGREAIEKLADGAGLLREAPENDLHQNIPIYSNAMIYGGSTWGAIYGPLARLEAMTGAEEFAKVRRGISQRLSKAFESAPILHTDFGASAIEVSSDLVVALDGPKEAEALMAMRQVLQEPAHAAITVTHVSPALPPSFRHREPSGTVRAVVFRGGSEAGTASSGAELRALLASTVSGE